MPKKLCGMVRKLQKLFAIMDQTMVLLLNKPDLIFATLRKNREAYIDRSRNSYDGSFKRNGVERIEGRARFVDSHTIEVNGGNH